VHRLAAITCRVACVVVAVTVALDAGRARAIGESVNGFPSWAERVIHEWINRARVDPQLEMDACGSPCVERACYAVMPPLSWSEALNRAARFHSDEMVRQGYFAHNSACTLVANINSLYPASCNGSASCACVGGTKACSPSCTGFAQRVQLFGASPSGEIIASPSNPNQAFYLWLYEPGDTMSCQFTSANGHRWLILKSTGAVGAGVAGYSTGDFGAGGVPAKIPSGAHYPQQAASVEAWANWYDSAAPTAASINVGGACTAMTLRRGTATNGAWAATLTGLGTGCHRYYFSFRDAAGTTVTYPTTGSLAIGSGAGCPDWDSTRPAACPGGAETPTPSPTSTPLPPTPAPTASATRTATATATRTASATPSPTATASASSTASATATDTAAPPSPTPSPTVPRSDASISGAVRYYSNEWPVGGVAVAAGAATGASTDNAGRYSLENVPAADLVVSAAADGGMNAAVSALDAAWVLQTVAGMRSFSPEQALAGDVTGDGSLSAYDAALILRYTVGLLPRLPVATACGSDWAFVPEPDPAPAQTVIAPLPSADPCRPGGIAYETVVSSLDGQNFAALAFGDCTGNWRPSTAAVRRANRAGDGRARPGRLQPLSGGRVRLPVVVEGAGALHAVEVRVDYDPVALRVVHTALVGRARGALLASNASEPGTLRLAIASAVAIATGRQPIAVVVFDALRADGASPAVSIGISGE
jgi:uncharacterized protein YkwD